MRLIFLVPIIVILLFNNYSWGEIKYAFNHYGELTVSSNPTLGIIIILIVLFIFSFSDELYWFYKFLKSKFQKRKF